MITHIERIFGFRDPVALWFSLGVGLLVMQVGGYLVPSMGTQSALLAIILGSTIGSGLLAWVAQLGSHYGMSSSGLMQKTLGSSFARLPVALNVVQLLGWTAFELVVMRDALSAMVVLKTVWFPVLATVLLGVILYLLASGSMIHMVRQWIARIGLPFVILSLLWSISWLPLVADYARYNKTDVDRHGAFKGTWMGYALANMWCYALGVLVVSISEPGADFMATLLLAQFGLIALGLILVDEIDNAYGDIHSGAVSLHHLYHGHSIVYWGKRLVIVAIGAAIFLPMHSLEPFLLMLSSVFVPLFGVIIAWLSFGGKATEASVNWPLMVIWLMGIAISHGARVYWPVLGQAIPSLAVTMLLTGLYRLNAHVFNHRLREL